MTEERGAQANNRIRSYLDQDMKNKHFSEFFLKHSKK